MDFRKYLHRRFWVLPLLVTIAFIVIDTVIHCGVTFRVSEKHLFQPPMPAGDSPTYYQFNQRDVILPYTGMDGYHWVMQTQDMLAKGDERVRWVDYDNYTLRAENDKRPVGREVHWSSSFRWWVALLAWIEHVYGGVPMPVAVEHVMPFANTLLITLLLIPLAPIVCRRLGNVPGSLMILGMGAILPLYQSFSEGKSDHHGLAALSTLLTLLFLLGGGAGWIRTGSATELAGISPFLAWLPDRTQAKRWFIASGVVGGIGLWVSTASEAPVLAEIGLAALVATGWLGYGVKPEDGARPDPSLWRVWGWAGAATSVFFYFVEYFPSHFGLRLEVNHPLYAAAWAGGGEIMYRVCRWWSGGKLVERPAEWLWLGLSVLGVITAPMLIFFFADKVFWVADRFLFLFHEDYIAEFKDVRRYMDPMYNSGSAKYLIAVLNPVALLAVPMVVWMWRQLRVPTLVAAALGALAELAYLIYLVILHFIVEAQAAKLIHQSPDQAAEILKSLNLHPLNNLVIPAVVGLAVFFVAAACLIFAKYEKCIMLVSLAVGLFVYDALLLSFHFWLVANPEQGPLDYYFWPSLTVPLVIIGGLLALWDPWPDFPRAAKAMMMLSLSPAMITLALSTREMRWMEQDFSLWLATIVGTAVILGNLRDYRWPRLPLALTMGLATLILGELKLHTQELRVFVEKIHVTEFFDWLGTCHWLEAILSHAKNFLLNFLERFHNLQVSLLGWTIIVIVLTVTVGRLRKQNWPKLARLALLIALPPCTVSFFQWMDHLNWLRGGWFSSLDTAWMPWLGREEAPWLAAVTTLVLILALQSDFSWKLRARLFTAAVLLGAIFLPSVVMTARDWPFWMGATPISDTELMEILTRDASQRLRARLGNETGVVVSGPTTTTWMYYWGNIKGLGTLYWENLEGLKADRDIYSAQTPAEAYKLIKERGVTHIAIFSWDPFYKEYARLALNRNRPYNPDEYNSEKIARAWLEKIHLISKPKNEVEDEKPYLQHAFLYDLLESYNVPTWLNPIYYPMPPDKQLRGSFILIFEVTPNQTPEEWSVRMAQYEIQRGNQPEVLKQLNTALKIHPDYLPALICAAEFDAVRGRDDEFQVIMQRIRMLLPMSSTLSLADHLDLALEFARVHDDEMAKQQIAASIPLATPQNLRRLTTDQLYHFISFMRQTGLANVRPGLQGYILTLMPNTLRAMYAVEEGQSLKLNDPARALALYQRALELFPESLPALVELARLRATSRDEQLRNGAEAVSYALKAREKDPGHGHETADALGCAYATNGQFDLAEKFEGQALLLAQTAKVDERILAAYRARLELFHNKQIFHE